MDETPPQIDSFVIRFIHLPPTGEPPEAGLEPDPGERRMVRGSVRHVQTNHEKGFTDWEEVEAFIRRYVPAIRSGER